MHPLAAQEFSQSVRQQVSDRAVQAPPSVLWPATPVLALPTERHVWRLPSPGHQLPAGQGPSTQASIPSVEHPPSLWWPAGQLAQVLHDRDDELEQDTRSPTWYCSAPQPLFP